MKLWSLAIEEQDNVVHYVYRSMEKALECVKGYICEKYSDVTQEELDEKQNEALNALLTIGIWKGDGYVYRICEKETID